jgi:hypothetical protein
MIKFICDVCGSPCELSCDVEVLNDPTRCPFDGDNQPSADWKEVEEIKKEKDSE